VGGGIVAVPGIVEGKPLIQWLILRGKASVLKQFFEVSEVVQNLSPEPFKLSAGSATLNVPPGMSFAPTATPQSATQSVATIPGHGSAETNWIVRGDKPGEYFLSADYDSKLEPFEAPVELEARLASPLKVWGVEALSLNVQADEGFLAEGRPYHVHIGVTNKANIPLYNVGVEIESNVHERFIFQPDQQFGDKVSELKPGETIYAPQDILVPDAASEAAFNPALSSAHFVGEEIRPGVGIEAVKPPPLYTISAPTDTAHFVHLHWQAAPSTEGYEVFSTQTLDTPFAKEPNEILASPSSKTRVTKLSASATDAYVPGNGTEDFYAVTSIIGGHATLNHTVIKGVEGHAGGGPTGGSLTAPELAAGGNNPSEFCLKCFMGKLISFILPVDAPTGNFWHSFDDLSVPGRGMVLNITRTYNSAAASTDSPFGYGWSFPYDMSLGFPDATHVVVNQENGSQVTFTEQAGGIYTAPPRVTATLEHNGDGSWTFVRRHKDTFSFDSSGRLTQENDLNGYVTALAYNGSGQLVTVTDPAGRKLTFAYTGNHISSVKDPLGRVVTYAYDGEGNLTDVTDVGGGNTHFTYASAHRVLTMRMPNQAPGVPGSTGAGVTNKYDSRGRVVEQTDQLGRTTKFAYTGEPFGEAGGSTTITDPKGNMTVQDYKFGELLSETKGYATPQAATWTFGYDPATLGMTIMTDPNGHTTTSTFDTEGNALTSTDPLGRTTTNTYDSLNDLLTSTDPMGVATTMTYDSRGDLLTRSRPLTGTSEVQTTTYSHEDSSHPSDVTAMTDPTGKTWKYSYDANSDRISTTDPLGNKTTSAYNAIGWLTSTTSPRGNEEGASPASFTTTYVHNNFGQVTETVDPLGHKTINEYDPDQSLVASTDATGHVTRYTYDAADERTAVHRPDGTTLTTTYWPDGTVKEHIDGAGHATRYEYDPLARGVVVVDPLARTTHYGYDPAGNRTTVTNPESGVITTSYDAANEPTDIVYSDGKTPNVTGITYDADGERTGMTDGSGTWSWTFDSLHRMTSVTEGAGSTVSYQYDLRGDLTAITYPNGKTVTRSYDAAGNLTGVTDWLGHTTIFGYDANSNLGSEQYPSSVNSQLGYNDANQLTSLNLTKSGASLASFSYTRDAIGQVSSETASNGEPHATSYTYDALNRLSGANAAPYAYDTADNPTTFGTGTSQHFDSANELTSRSEPGEASEHPGEGPKEEGPGQPKEGPKEGPKEEGPKAPGTGSGNQGGTSGSGVAGQHTIYIPATPNATVKATAMHGGKLVSPKLHTSSANALVLVFISAAGPGSGGQRVMRLSGDGLRWSLVTRSARGGGAVEVWQAHAIHPLRGSVTAQLRSNGYPATLIVAAFNGSSTYVAGHVTSHGHASTPTIRVGGASGADIWAVGQSNGQKGSIAPIAGQRLLAKYLDSASHRAGWIQEGRTSSASARLADANPAAQWQMVAVAVASRPAQTARVSRMVSPPLVNSAPGSPLAPSNASTVASARRAASWSVASASSNVTRQYTYNARGDRIGEGSNGTSLSLSYDQEDRLIGVGNSDSYAYNGDGLRISKTVSGVTTRFVWSEAGSLPDLLQDGSTYYIYGPEDTPIEQISGSTPIYTHQDQRGSTRLLTDAEGNVVGRYEYDAWGKVTSHTGSATTNLQYDGQYTDAETGFQYLRARYYDSSTGQFLTEDPAYQETGSRYGYAGSDPLSASDPSGESLGDPFGFITTGIDVIKAASSTFAVPFVCIGGGGCKAAVHQAGHDIKQAAIDVVEGKFLKFPTIVVPQFLQNLGQPSGSSPMASLIQGGGISIPYSYLGDNYSPIGNYLQPACPS
jgi:RHS repeat-associated protein